jgi:cation diffusion facilitator family transporter
MKMGTNDETNHAHGYERDADHGGGSIQAHGHNHDHPDQGGDGHDHGHAHRSGVLGWLQHTFAHSHDVHEKVDDAMETSERGIWALKVSLISLGLTAIFQVIIVLASGSVGLLADTIHNFGDAATSLPLWVAFALVRRGQTRRYPYGYGRVEDVAGVMIVLVILFSACVAGYESLRKLIDPQPVTHLWWVAAAALIGFIGNEAVAVLRIRVGNQIGSAALVADGQHSRVDGFTSLAVLVGAIGVAAGAPILDPLIGLAITIAILFIVKDAAKAVFRRLLDGIEPEILAEIEHAPLHIAGVQNVHAVRARWIGHRVQADMHVTLDRTLSVGESHAIIQKVEEALSDHVTAFGGATIHVCPCAHPEPAPQPSAAAV